MMLLLIGDIGFELTSLGTAHRKGTIPALPGEILQVRELLVDPTGAIGLNVADGIGDRFILPELREQVDVIVDAADDDRVSALLPDRPAEILMHSFTNIV